MREHSETAAAKVDPDEPDARQPVVAALTQKGRSLEEAGPAAEASPELAPEPAPAPIQAGDPLPPGAGTEASAEPPAPDAAPAPTASPEPAPPPAAPEPAAPPAAPQPAAPAAVLEMPAPAGDLISLAESARRWLRSGPSYDSTYLPIPYPGGDVPAHRGAAVDLVVRAFRGLGVDLQREIHEEILADPEAYGVAAPDTNIDHRRIRNVVTFLSRRATNLSTERGDDWRAGDLVVWDVNGDGRSDHLGILSERAGADGSPLVIHHFRPNDVFSGSPSEDDVLFRWPVRAHFRWQP